MDFHHEVSPFTLIMVPNTCPADREDLAVQRKIRIIPIVCAAPLDVSSNDEGLET